MKLKSFMLLALLVVLCLSLRDNTKAQDDSGQNVYLPLVMNCCEEETDNHDEMNEVFAAAVHTLVKYQLEDIPTTMNVEYPIDSPRSIPDVGGGSFEAKGGDNRENEKLTCNDVLWTDSYHMAQDFFGNAGTEIRSPVDGVIIRDHKVSGSSDNGALLIAFRVPNGEIYFTWLLHFTPPAGSEGQLVDQRVKAGEPIYIDWKSANPQQKLKGLKWWGGTDYHLHLEIFRFNAVDGAKYAIGGYTGVKSEAVDPPYTSFRCNNGPSSEGYFPVKERADRKRPSQLGWENPLDFMQKVNCGKAEGYVTIVKSDGRCVRVKPASPFTLLYKILKAMLTGQRLVFKYEPTSQNVASASVSASAATTALTACVDWDLSGDLHRWFYPGSPYNLRDFVTSISVESGTCAGLAKAKSKANSSTDDAGSPKGSPEEMGAINFNCNGVGVVIYSTNGSCFALEQGWNYSLPFSPHKVVVFNGTWDIRLCTDKGSPCDEVNGTRELTFSSIYGKISRIEVRNPAKIENFNDYVGNCKTRTGRTVGKGELDLGVKYYSDRNYVVEQIGEDADPRNNSLYRAPFLKTPNDDNRNPDPEYIVCDIYKHVKVTIAIDRRSGPPNWVKNNYRYEDSEIAVSDDGANSLKLWSCKQAPGKLILGGPHSDGADSKANYIVIFKKLDSNDGTSRCSASFNVKPDIPTFSYPVGNSQTLTETPLIVWEQSDKNTGDKLFAQLQVYQNDAIVYDSGFLPEGVEQHVPVINGYGYFTAHVVVKDLAGEWNVSNTIGFTILQPDCNNANFGEVAVTTSDSCRGEVTKLGNSGKVDLVSKGLYGKSISVWVPQDSWALLLEKADGSAGENCVGWYNGEPGHKWATTVVSNAKGNVRKIAKGKVPKIANEKSTFSRQ